MIRLLYILAATLAAFYLGYEGAAFIDARYMPAPIFVEAVETREA